MLSMIEREGPGETALHKATRLAYEVNSHHCLVYLTVTLPAAAGRTIHFRSLSLPSLLRPFRPA